MFAHHRRPLRLGDRMLAHQERRDLDPMLRPLVVGVAALRRPHQERAAGDRHQLQDDAVRQRLDELLRLALLSVDDLALSVDGDGLECDFLVCHDDSRPTTGQAVRVARVGALKDVKAPNTCVPPTVRLCASHLWEQITLRRVFT